MRSASLKWVSLPGVLVMMNFLAPDSQALEVPVIIAHRGASGVAPENTEVAIREALRMGAKVIEFDVRGTADGNLVLFHDDKLERLAGREGSIESITLEEVSSLEVGKWFGDGSFDGEKVIDLAGAIRMCFEGGAIPLIERKSGEAAIYAEVIRSLGAEEKVIVQSFDWKFLEAFREELPKTPIGALGSKTFSGDKVMQIESLKPEWVGWKFSDMTPPGLEMLNALGSRVALWTVNDPEVASKWLEAGVDGIITDHPDKMLLLIE